MANIRGIENALEKAGFAFKNKRTLKEAGEASEFSVLEECFEDVAEALLVTVIYDFSREDGSSFVLTFKVTDTQTNKSSLVRLSDVMSCIQGGAKALKEYCKMSRRG